MRKYRFRVGDDRRRLRREWSATSNVLRFVDEDEEPHYAETACRKPLDELFRISSMNEIGLIMRNVKLRREGTALVRSDDERVALLAKALAHPARVQIIRTLMRRTTCIGCDIVEEIGLAASTTSEHLRILKEAGLIVGEIERPRVCYSLNPAALKPLAAFLDRATAKLIMSERG